MAAPYPEGFEPIETPSYPEGFEPVSDSVEAPDIIGKTPDEVAAAASRLSQDQFFTKTYGGSPLDPVTGEPAYSPAQKELDLRTVGFAREAQGVEAAAAQNRRAGLFEGATPLQSRAASGAAAVAQIPIGLASLIGRAAQGAIPGVSDAFPVGSEQDQLTQDLLSSIASQNPRTAALSQSIAGSVAGVGGAAQRGAQSLAALLRGNPALARQLGGSALMEAAPVAVAVPTISAGVRALSGEGTTVPQALQEALVGALSAGRIGPAAVGELPVLGLTEGISDSLRASAKKSVEQALGATTQSGKAQAARVADQLLERPLSETFSFTRRGLEVKSEAALEKAAQALDDFGTLKGEVNPQKIVNALEGEKSKFIVQGREIDPEAIKRIGLVQDVFNQFGDAIDLESLRGIRRIFDKEINQSKGFFKTVDQGSMLDIKKIATKEIRQVLAEEVPDLAVLNKQFNFWSNLNDVVSATNKRTGSQGSTLANVATIGGAISGATIPDAATKALLFRAVTQAVRSPGWKLTTAKVKNSLANALSSGGEKEVFSALDTVPQFNTSALRDELSTLRSSAIASGELESRQ